MGTCKPAHTAITATTATAVTTHPMRRSSQRAGRTAGRTVLPSRRRRTA